MPRRFKRAALWGLVLLLAVGVAFAAPQPQQIDNFTSFTSSLRADIEGAANDALGQGVRPPDWTSNIDITSETYVADLWYDKELLANVLFGEFNRPDGWLGITVERGEIVARNTRFDLEILADNIYGGTETRPPTWAGAAPIYRCERIVQNINALMRDFYGFQANTQDDAFGFCALIRDELELAILEDEGLDVSGDVLDQEILAARGDLERIANEVYGVNSRPIGWRGNTDAASPLLLTDTYEDLRILGDETLGLDVRPDGFIGRITESRVETFRNLRYDLELLTDATLPTFPSLNGERPRGWQGTDLLRRCTPTTQDLVLLLEAQYGTDDLTPFNRGQFEAVAEDAFCDDIRERANDFAELRPPTAEERLAQVATNNLTFESDFAFTYLDPAALQYMGVMPRGTPFRAWYRNFNDSTMMFVSGQDFALFIDRRFTNMPQDTFDRLPTLEGIAPLTFCDTNWCDGPGPTPTPTGGALESLLFVQTPAVPPTVDAGAVASEEKTQVNFENVCVTYLSDNIQTGTAQVILELCQEPQRITCEPVITILDLTTNAPKPVISTQNGENVYEFSYSYNFNLSIESATLRSPDVFLTDPTLPRDPCG
jgi:hypothetical protein